MNQQTRRLSGFECPACKGFIPISVAILIKERAITCPQCDLQLTINQAASKKAIDALDKVQSAQDSVNKASVFRK